jgi:hypothetical protein
MSRSVLLSSLLVLSVGCAGTGNAVRAAGPEARMGQRSAEPMVVTETYVTGPSSSLSLKEDGMRGRFRDRAVDLKWDYQSVTGVFASSPTKLVLSEGDDTRVEGSFGGARVDILMKQDVLLARVGGCAYYMQRVEGGYSGKRDCAGPLEEEFYVDFPENLQERPLGQMATLLAMSLFSYTETYSPAVSPARFTTSREQTHILPRTSCRKGM